MPRIALACFLAGVMGCGGGSTPGTPGTPATPSSHGRGQDGISLQVEANDITIDNQTSAPLKEVILTYTSVSGSKHTHRVGTIQPRESRLIKSGQTLWIFWKGERLDLQDNDGHRVELTF